MLLIQVSYTPGLVFFAQLHNSANVVNKNLYLWVASVLRSVLLARTRISIIFGNVYCIKDVCLKSTMQKARCHHPRKPGIRMNSLKFLLCRDF